MDPIGPIVLCFPGLSGYRSSIQRRTPRTTFSASWPSYSTRTTTWRRSRFQAAEEHEEVSVEKSGQACTFDHVVYVYSHVLPIGSKDVQGTAGLPNIASSLHWL